MLLVSMLVQINHWMMGNSMQSFRLHNPNLSPETSTNTSIGFVYSPSIVEGLTFTYDNWKIEKEDTICSSW